MPTPLLIALQFLTRIPIRIAGTLSAEEIGRSLAYYPLVGLVIGALLALGASLLEGVPTLLAAALLLALWVAVTGALHLDGLADSVDAWIGGQGDRERTLAIMKDPNTGAMGVVALALILLLKLAALAALLAAGRAAVDLLLPPLLGRTALPLLFLTTPYVRSSGLGTPLAAGHGRKAAAALTLIGYVVPVLMHAVAGLAAVVVALGVFVLLRAAMLRRLGGSTGDTAGTLVELTETSVLVTLALLA